MNRKGNVCQRGIQDKVIGSGEVGLVVLLTVKRERFGECCFVRFVVCACGLFLQLCVCEVYFCLCGLFCLRGSVCCTVWFSLVCAAGSVCCTAWFCLV